MPFSTFYNPYLESELSFPISYNKDYYNQLEEYIDSKILKSYTNYTITNHFRTNYPDTVLTFIDFEKLKQKFISKYINIYFKGVQFDPFIEVTNIYFNENLTIANVEFESIYFGGEYEFICENNIWIKGNKVRGWFRIE